MIGILIDDTGDLQVNNGSLVLGNIDEQIAQMVVVANPGDIKESPMLGKSIDMLINGSPDEFWKMDLITQLKTQHLNPKKVTITETEINVDL
ncbi:MAG: hypothetical protein ACYC6C_05605 [Coriobacteriia bacterium]